MDTLYNYWICLQRILGTPTEKNWPGVSQLQDYKTSFPKWSGEGLKKAVPQLDENGLDLLEVDDSCLKLYIIISQTRTSNCGHLT